MGTGISLRDYRLRRGETLAEWRVRTGVDEATLSRVERGRQVPRADTIIRLARGLGLSAGRVDDMIRASSAADAEVVAS